ncbi:MAG: hypothetical protein ACRENH_09015 [Gemmatimonadaceae bacterium]
MVTPRAGRGKLGCLFLLLLLAAVVYVGVDVGEAYWRYYRFRDAVEQEAQYGANRSDADIKRRLIALADSLGLPDDASSRLRVHRSANRLFIQTEYTEHIDKVLYKRDIKFAPSAELRF